MTDPRPPFQGDSSRGRLPRAEVLGCFPFVLRALGIHTRKCPNCRAKGSNSFAVEPGGYSFAHKGTSLTERSRSVSLMLLNVICPSGTRSRRGVLKTLTVLRCGTSDLAISPLIPSIGDQPKSEAEKASSRTDPALRYGAIDCRDDD